MIMLLNDAIAACEQALQSQTDVQQPCQQLGNLLQGAGRFEEALYWHTQARQSPEPVELWIRLGQLYVQQQQFAAALAAYQTALTIQPHQARLHWLLANLYGELGQQAEENHYRQMALQLEPISPQEQFAVGNALLEQQRVNEAIPFYRSAVQLQPDFWAAHYNLGVALTSLGAVDAAIAAFQRVVSLQPDYTKAYLQLGKLLEQQQQWQAALDAYLSVLATDPQPTLYFSLGELYLKLGQPQPAAALFQQAVQADPDLIWAYHHWIEALIQLQQWQAATEACERALAAGHQMPWICTFRGRILTLQNQPEAASSWYEQGCLLRGWHQFGQKHYCFTQDWFSHNIPIWTELLSELAGKPGLQMLEIGSYQGMSACWLLDQILTHSTARLTCIDPNFQPLFAKNLAKTGAVEQVTVLQGYSHNLLPTLMPNSFDGIYIDGCHLADSVRRDAELAWELLKPAGVMIFDDYQWQDPAHPGQDPRLGIDAFVNSRQTQIAILHQGYQLILRKLDATQR